MLFFGSPAEAIRSPFLICDVCVSLMSAVGSFWQKVLKFVCGDLYVTQQTAVKQVLVKEDLNTHILHAVHLHPEISKNQPGQKVDNKLRRQAGMMHLRDPHKQQNTTQGPGSSLSLLFLQFLHLELQPTHLHVFPPFFTLLSGFSWHVWMKLNPTCPLKGANFLGRLWWGRIESNWGTFKTRLEKIGWKSLALSCSRAWSLKNNKNERSKDVNLEV